MPATPSTNSRTLRGRLAAAVGRREEEMLRLLEAMVLQQSPSRHKQGVDAVGALVAAAAQPLGLCQTTCEEQEFGNHLFLKTSAAAGGAPAILLFGHLDTVFPLDSPFTTFVDDGRTVRGPGVIDMKGGVVCALYALKALADCGLLADIPLTLLCNSEEEIGSPTSTALFREEARRSCAALGFECGGLAGEVVTGRKGRSGWRLSVSGRAGHAAFAGPDKASAILELAHEVILLEGLNDAARGIVVNVGVVGGGIGPNTVSDSAFAEIDTRFLRQGDALATAERIADIAARPTVVGTRSTLLATGSRPPMEQSEANTRLYGLIKEEADQLCLPCVAELRSGVSDANTLCHAGLAVVDGLGPIGACDHSEREYMVRASLAERTLLAATTILRLHEEGWTRPAGETDDR